MLTGVGICFTLFEEEYKFLVRPHLVDLRAQVRGKAARSLKKRL
jgi:hypothetical protein